MADSDTDFAVWEFPESPEVTRVARQLAGLPYCLVLSSSQRHPQLGRYSFAMADPIEFLQLGARPSVAEPAWRRLQQLATTGTVSAVTGLPPFQGGLAGLFGYELNAAFERIPPPAIDEFQLPCLALGVYDTVMAWDHDRDRCWIVARDIPAMAGRQNRSAEERIARLRAVLSGAALMPATMDRSSPVRSLGTPCVPTEIPGLYSNFSQESYVAMVSAARERIWSGELFQVNLSQRLVRRCQEHPLDVFIRLQQRTPAPFSCYFDLGAHQIVSVSPERFLQMRGGHLEARPIKGTRQGMPLPEADLFARADLSASGKDQAENTMIVDLLRNDLSRVCTDESVQVTQLCGLESHRYVHHLVSVVEGDLAAGRTGLDVIRAAFPCGSVTGAPKVRAMETIAELEKVARGPYCGSLGYLGLDGNMDLNVLIRTMTFSGGWCQLPVGGGIVADSDPLQEYRETWHKAAALL